MTAWMVLIAVAIGTYALRVSMFVLLGRRSLPGWTLTPMSLVAPATVAALVTSMLFTAHGQVLTPSVPEVAAVAAGFGAVLRTQNVMHALLVGMPVYWVLLLVVP